MGSEKGQGGSRQMGATEEGAWDVVGGGGVERKRGGTGGREERQVSGGKGTRQAGSLARAGQAWHGEPSDQPAEAEFVLWCLSRSTSKGGTSCFLRHLFTKNKDVSQIGRVQLGLGYIKCFHNANKSKLLGIYAKYFSTWFSQAKERKAHWFW